MSGPRRSRRAASPGWRAVGAGALALMLVGGTVGHGAAAGSSTPTCTVLDVSPRFGADGVAFCASMTVDGGGTARNASLRLFRTTDFGRTWRGVPTTGLDRVPSAAADLTQLVVSPMFATDRRLLVQLAGSTYETRDGGATFTRLASTANGAEATTFRVANVTSYVEVEGGLGAGPVDVIPGGRRAVFAVAGAVPQVIDQAWTLPVRAAVADGVRAVRFEATAGRVVDRYLVGTVTRSTGAEHATVYQCDPRLACATRLHTFGFPSFPVGVWLDPGRRGLYVAVGEGGELPAGVGAGKVYVHRSTDGGRTFHKLVSVNRLLDEIYRPIKDECAAYQPPRVSFAFDRGRIYVRISGWVPGVGPTDFCKGRSEAPADAVYESVDDARSWRRVAFAVTDGHRPARATGSRAPWTGVAGPVALRGAITAAGGRLFVVATTGTYAGPFCSSDGGRTWATRCTR